MNWSVVSVAVLTLLPTRLRDLARLIGLATAMTIVQHYGGRRLYIPSRAAVDHPLVAIGNANALCGPKRRKRA